MGERWIFDDFDELYVLKDAVANSAEEHDDGKSVASSTSCLYGDLSCYERAFWTVQLVAFEIKDVVLDVGKANSCCKPEHLQNQNRNGRVML